MKTTILIAAALAFGATSFPQVANAECTAVEKRKMKRAGMTKAQIERACEGDDEDQDFEEIDTEVPDRTPPRMSNRCVTPVIACFIRQMGPVGTPCWCATPYGPANGGLN